MELCPKMIYGNLFQRKRDKEVICVVEGVRDVIAFEKSETYSGLYHVLGGKIDPLNGDYDWRTESEKLMNS